MLLSVNAITNPNTISSIKRIMGTSEKVEIEWKEIYTRRSISYDSMRYMKDYAERLFR